MTENGENKKEVEKPKYSGPNFEIIDKNLGKLYQYITKMVPDSFEKSQILIKISEGLMWNKLAFDLDRPFEPVAEIRNLKVQHPEVEEKN